MRFRKYIRTGKNTRLNVSKSGVSATVGIKGLSLSVGKNGAYLNTSIPGTGLYDRTRIGGVKMVENRKSTENRSIETMWNMAANDYVRSSFFEDSFTPPNKVFNGILSFFLFISGISLIIFSLMEILWITFYLPIILPIPILILGIVFLILHFKNHRKAKKNYQALIKHTYEKYAEYQENLRIIEEANQKMYEAKINAINSHELFDGAKIFTIDMNNIIAFSEKRFVAIWTEKDNDKMQILGVDKITKINQEIKSGDCFAHIYTDNFENNVFDLYIGSAHGKDGIEEVRKLYNEIKNMYTTLKNKKE